MLMLTFVHGLEVFFVRKIVFLPMLDKKVIDDGGIKLMNPWLMELRRFGMEDALLKMKTED